jgi:quaternary ammonium compound-resistance protein SugE
MNGIMAVSTARPWLSLLLSGAFEVGWIVSLKAMDGLSRGLPLLGYAVFGLGASVFLSLALKSIPLATAYAVWMGVSVIGTVLVDAAVFKQPWTVFRGVCAILIVAGACGLKIASNR